MAIRTDPCLRHAFVAALVATSTVAGQNHWIIDIAYSDPAGVINSLDDTATVTLWTAFDPQYFAFHQSELDVRADDELDAGEWSDPRRLLAGPYSKDGAVDGEIVVDVCPTQIHFPEAGLFADESNPIAAWTATWRTLDLHARRVLVTTSSDSYDLYTDKEGDSADFLSGLSEGAGDIMIVPAPAGAAVGLIGGTWLTCRGRRRAIRPS